MDSGTSRYYEELGRDYPVSIRQLVPGYDDLTRTLAGLLAEAEPASILDVGCGEGTLTRLVLEAVPGARITALDVSDAMLETARSRVGTMADRVRFVKADVTDWREGGSFDAGYSNLVLHNLAHEEKLPVLSRVREMLVPGGPFLWGDLIRHEDPVLQDRFVRARIRHARASGCDEEMIRRNFEKEAEDDHPLTLPETLEAARAAGFSRSDPVWMRDTFALLHLRA